MNKIWKFVKNNFLTKKFLTFGLIGVANTAIHMLVYYTTYNRFVLGPFWSNTLAFITASVFSYFANALLTFKPKRKTTVQFSIVMFVYLTRLLISSGLTTLFDALFLNTFNMDYSAYPLLELLAPLLASALLIPIAYFALDWVFKKTDTKKAV